MLFIRPGVFLASHDSEFQYIYICPELHCQAIANKIQRVFTKNIIKKRKSSINVVDFKQE